MQQIQCLLDYSINCFINLPSESKILLFSDYITMSDFELSDVAFTDSEISRTSTDTEDESKDLCDDLTVLDVDINTIEDGDFEYVSVIDSSRDVCTREENIVEITWISICSQATVFITIQQLLGMSKNQIK